MRAGAEPRPASPRAAAVRPDVFTTGPDGLRAWRHLPAGQQPGWPDGLALARIRAQLAARPPLVDPADTTVLRTLLAEVARGRALVVQAGDCAEDPAECVPEHLGRKVGLLEALAGALRAHTGLPVLRVGRIAGQFAKPRSRPTEVRGGVELPAYRGPMVNSPEPHPAARRPDPGRLLACHDAAAAAMRYLHSADAGPPGGRSGPAVWTSHEALVLDYEVPQLRRGEDGRYTLTSTHWPWIGERTRRADGAHVALLAAVRNPVACKVGPRTTEEELLELCERLDPRREPGRLTLISRMGADLVRERLPGLVAAVRAAGHPVVWLCDPMHGNTVTAPDARKTRLVATVVREVQGFRRAVALGGGTAGGLHLEATPHPVTECAADEGGLGSVGEHYTTLCDPRLNPRQALAVVHAWNEATSEGA